MHKIIQEKKYDFLKEGTKVLDKIPRLHILKQIFSQNPTLYESNSNTNQLQKVGHQPKNLLKTVVGNDFNL